MVKPARLMILPNVVRKLQLIQPFAPLAALLMAFENRSAGFVKVPFWGRGGVAFLCRRTDCSLAGCAWVSPAFWLAVWRLASDTFRL